MCVCVCVCVCCNCSKLYWVDAKHKTLNSVDVASGSSRAPVPLGGVAGSGHVYGLAFNDAGTAYVSCWTSSASIIRVNGNAEVYKSGLSTGAVFSNVYISSGQQPSSVYHQLLQLLCCISISRALVTDTLMHEYFPTITVLSSCK